SLSRHSPTMMSVGSRRIAPRTKAAKVGKSRGISVWLMVEVTPRTRSSRNSTGADPSTISQWLSGSCSFAKVMPAISVDLPLRQEKSWKGEWKRNLKPFEAIQRVRPPPGRGAARQPEASLAWETATSLVKRRQQMLKPCVSLEIEYPLGPSVWVSRGRCRQDR